MDNFEIKWYNWKRFLFRILFAVQAHWDSAEFGCIDEYGKYYNILKYFLTELSDRRDAESFRALERGCKIKTQNSWNFTELNLKPEQHLRRTRNSSYKKIIQPSKICSSYQKNLKLNIQTINIYFACRYSFLSHFERIYGLRKVISTDCTKNVHNKRQKAFSGCFFFFSRLRVHPICPTTIITSEILAAETSARVLAATNQIFSEFLRVFCVTHQF